MTDLWILAFVMRGIVGAAGDVMPLEQCEWRGRDMGELASNVVCINVHDPSCRIYRDSTKLYGWDLHRVHQPSSKRVPMKYVKSLVL